MGSSTYSADVHVARAATRAATGTPTFVHTAAVASGAVAASLHPSLDIRGKDRESRDSAAHPRSKSIVVMFDHTGSMGQVPVIMQQKLPGRRVRGDRDHRRAHGGGRRRQRHP